MAQIIDEVKGLYQVIAFDTFRKTEGVAFDMIPMDAFDHIDSIDRVIHEHQAVSPAPTQNNPRPWYMHPYQDDNLIVLQGTRYVDIYSVEHGRVESFEVSPNQVIKNGEILHQGSCMLVWPHHVFHRIVSGKDGSASMNIAVHYEGYNIKDNFDIFDLNTETGEYKVAREGFKDQF